MHICQLCVEKKKKIAVQIRIISIVSHKETIVNCFLVHFKRSPWGVAQYHIHASAQFMHSSEGCHLVSSFGLAPRVCRLMLGGDIFTIPKVVCTYSKQFLGHLHRKQVIDISCDYIILRYIIDSDRCLDVLFVETLGNRVP